MGRTESISTTVRIPKDIFEKIELEAQTKDSPIATVINNVLRKHVTWDRFVSEIGFMYMQKPFLRALFETNSEKDVKRLATTIGYARTRDAILFISGKVDTKGIIDVVTLWLSTSNVPVRVTKSDDTIKFIVQHNMGKKWSIYFANVLKSLFSELKISSKKEDLEEHTVSIEFGIKASKAKKRK